MPALSSILPPFLGRSRRRGGLTVLLAVGLLTIAAGWTLAGHTAGSEAFTYREAVVGQPSRISPLAEHTNQAEADLTALVFNGLMRLGPDGAPEPDLAERWEVTPDQLTYTFHLRQGVTWHDGAAFDAADVAFTIGRIQAQGFDGPEALKARWEGVQVFVDDADTVLIRLPEPAADFLVRASLGILPEHLAGEMSPAEGFNTRLFDRNPIGTGPFRLTSLNDGRAILKHNTSYHRGTPPIPRLELRFAASEEQQREWLASGTVDGALLEAGGETIEELLAGRQSLADTELATNAQTVLYLNNQRGPLSDERTRAALVASVDTQSAVAVSASPERPGAGVIPPGSWLSAAADGEGADADALWTAAQWERRPDGTRSRDREPLALELVTNGEPERIALAEAVAAQLREAGVTVEVITAPAQRVANEYLRSGDYDLAIFGWETPANLDPYAAWHTSQLGGGNVAGFSDAEADALLEAARMTLDVAERRELYALFQARFDELGASLVLGYPTRRYVHPSGLAGFEPMLLIEPSSRFQDIHRWRMPE